MRSIFSITAAGGAEAAVITSTFRPLPLPLRTASGALASMLRTIGAAQKCVTPSVAIASRIAPASTRRRQTLVPSIAAIVHGKHQPLQWNIGSVQR